MDMHRFVEAFLSATTWRFKEKDIKHIGSEESVSVCEEFMRVFPKMAAMLSEAVKIEIELHNGKKFWLVCWEKKDEICGWLCLPAQEKIHKTVGKEHQLLLKNFGGILESFGGDDSKTYYLWNMNSVFCEEDASEGIGAWEEFFLEWCEDEELEPKIVLEDLIVTAVEINGNVTLYNKNTGEILVYAHDHCFDYLQTYPNCPEYTFHTILGCNSFRDWVEDIAMQWRCCCDLM